MAIRDGKTKIEGDQCVIYAGKYFGKKFGVTYAYQIWDASSVTQLSGPQSGCCAVWSGGDDSCGHVGVVESWNSSNKTMNFSDSNFDGDEIVYKNTGITERTMKDYFTDKYTFEGYVKFK